MVQAIRKRVKIKLGGVVELRDTSLPEGATAEVIVLLGPNTERTGAGREREPLADLVGAARGVFLSADEIDEYVRNLREEWD